MRHDLMDGGHVEYRPVTDLKGGDRDAIEHWIRLKILAAARSLNLESAQLTGQQCAETNCIPADLRFRGMLARVIKAWSLEDDGQPIPVPVLADNGQMEHEDTFGKLPLGPLNEIEELIIPHIRLLLRVPDPKGDPLATTAASNGRSPAKARSPRG